MNRMVHSHWNPFQRHNLGGVLKESEREDSVSRGSKSKTWETTVERVPSWPEEARPLKHRDWVAHLFLFGDIVLVLLPIYFILLGVAAAKLNGQAVDENVFGSKVTSAIQLGPTIFPIMFAAICGRSMKMIARYLAEQGAKLSTLELLMASQSVWGTFESQVLMRRLTIVGVNLLFLWAMSPLGGQASLRLLEVTTSTAQSFTPLRYLSTGPGSTVWAMTSGTYVESDGGLTQVEGLYAAALLGSKQAKEGPEDTWGNVKIPYINITSQSSNGPELWTNVTHDLRSPEDYFSLVGIPVVGRPIRQDGTFNLETSHLTVECGSFTSVRVNRTDYTRLQSLAPGQIWKNMSERNSPWGGDGIGGRTSTFFLQTNLPLTLGGDDGDGRFNSYAGFINSTMAGQSFPKREITYASSFRYDDQGITTMNMINCSLGQVHVETVVTCLKENCFAVQSRPSLSDLRDANTTPFDHGLIAELALTAFPKTFGWSKGSNPTEQFIHNTTSFQFASPGATFGASPGWVNLAELDSSVFSRRLALLLNTYYQLTISPSAFLGSLPQHNASAFGPDTLPIKDADVYLPENMTTQNTSFENWYTPFQLKTFNSGIYFVGATTNATISSTHSTYACNFAWLSLLLAAASIILFIGVGSLILKRKTLGPEMFGFVASLTYENRFIKLPEGGSMLDAMERARLLKDVEVAVGDVYGNADIGHIALAAGVPLRKLERGRLYY
ncbi:hypothetical protein DE146DRAFT_754085 [Phaeosphaeria sp. MPI-PUGE-AT-0046c]|nr:hypothetical protein DE146DRAFT_754085 [Phaeosphaeria sp. MPI-PUGE-AT-0046c]